VLCLIPFVQVARDTFAVSSRTASRPGWRPRPKSDLQNAANLVLTSTSPRTCHTTRPDLFLLHRTCSCQITTLLPHSNLHSALSFEMTPQLDLPVESHSLCTMRLQLHGTPDPSGSESISLSLLPCHGHRMLWILRCHFLLDLHSYTSRCSLLSCERLHSTSCPEVTWALRTELIRWCRFARGIVIFSKRRCYQGALSRVFCACASLDDVWAGLCLRDSLHFRRSQRDCACASQLK
jgi:hypothetical protein